MKKSKIALLVSILFIFFLSSSFDFPRFRKQKPDHIRMHRYQIYPFNNGQPHIIGERHYAPDRVLVKFNPTLSTQTIETTINAYQAKEIKRIPKLDTYLLEIPANSTVEETVYALRLNPDVAHVSPDYKTFVTAVPKPRDNLFFRQYYLYNEGQEFHIFGLRGKNRADIKALEAWEETKGDEQVVIAVIDSGIDFEHPDLANTDEVEKISPNGYDFVNGDNDPSDDHGHGTFVSGLIAAKSNNGEGIAGVSWHSQILPLKAVESDGTGYVSWLVEAIRYAADNGADVISMSLGFSLGPNEEVPSLEEALSYAKSKGLVVVAAAGNEGSSVLYPAAYDEYCIAVAATDYNDSRPAWSNFGPEVDVAAPGATIWSLVPTWLEELYLDDYTLDPYGWGDGTSASAAIVSGCVALIMSIKPWLEPDEIMDIIRYSADDLNVSEYPGKDEFIGYGRINLEKALVPIKLITSK
ncbi:MAG: peptidase S8 [Candidatus Aminicenantes bacterium]|nr:MAG: peptidase S8 [Candidatus Aminicenantes bacterium]